MPCSLIAFGSSEFEYTYLVCIMKNKCWKHIPIPKLSAMGEWQNLFQIRVPFSDSGQRRCDCLGGKRNHEKRITKYSIKKKKNPQKVRRY